MRPIKEIAGRKLFKDTLAFQAGVFASAIIALVTSVFLTGILGDEDYGTYAMIFALFSLSNITRLIASPQATINRIAENNAAKLPDEVREVIGYYLKMRLLCGTALALFGLILGPLFAELVYNKTLISLAVRLIFLTAFLNSFNAVAGAVLMGFRRMFHCTVLNVGQMVFRLVLIIIFLVCGWGVTGVVVAHILSMAIASVAGIILLVHARRTTDADIPGIGEMLSWMLKAPLIRHTRFSLPVSLNSYTSSMLSRVPVLFLGRFAEGNKAAGYFNLGLHIVTALWSGFLGLSKNLLPYLSEFKGRKDIRILNDRFLKITVFGGITGVIFGAAFTLVMPYMIHAVYGYQWAPVIPLVYILMIQYVFQSFGIATEHFLLVAGRIWFALLSKIIMLVASLPLAYLLITRMGQKGAAIYYSGIISLIMLVYLFYITSDIRRLRRNDHQPQPEEAPPDEV